MSVKTQKIFFVLLASILCIGSCEALYILSSDLFVYTFFPICIAILTYAVLSFALSKLSLKCSKNEFTDQRKEELEDVLICIGDSSVTSATFASGRFFITDELEYTPEGERRSWDTDDEEPLMEIKWVSMSDVLQLIE